MPPLADDVAAPALTPAEELGLAGVRLAACVRHALYHVPAADLARAHERIAAAARERGLVYFHDGRVETIRVLPCPITVLPDEVAYLHGVTHTIQEALKRLPDLYLTDPEVRDLLRLEPEEEEWLRECWWPGGGARNPIFGRLDAMIDFAHPMWKDTFHFVEPNLNGVGGIHLVPTVEEIVEEVVVPLLGAADRALRLERLADIRELLLEEVRDHLAAIGRPCRRLCFVEPKYELEGPDEQRALAEYYGARHGVEVVHADPAELRLRDDDVWCGDAPVDLVYRDYSVLDLVELAREGVDVEPMRRLFRENRVISSIGGELDQKSCWELLTDPRLAARHFDEGERRVFERHILWTRLLADRRTTLPGGEEGDLVTYARREHECLVLKPNRGYGGEGVLIGHTVGRAEWEAALDAALADTERWVVQRLAGIPAVEFPTLCPEGTLRPEPFYTVMGFAPGRERVAILARCSQRQVVNVAQRGGMCAVMTGAIAPVAAAGAAG